MAVRAKHVFRWDLDKTYLRSEFEHLRDLIKSAFEDAADKKAFPGATALLRSLRQTGEHRICIISGSPSQMRRVLSAKLALDGIEYDEFVLKNNIRNLRKLRFRALRAQLPYKLPALLESRAGLLGAPPETLFGDDAEADAIIYSLYADILSGRVGRHELERIMDAARAYDDQASRILALAEGIRQSDAVSRILIHLEGRSPTSVFTQYGRRLTPIYNYFQAALLLYADELLSARQVLYVARDMIASGEYQAPTLANSLQDLIRRGRLDPDVAQALCLEFQEITASGGQAPGNQPEADEIAWTFAERIRALGGSASLEWPAEHPNLDYVSMVDAEFRKRTQK